MNDKHIPCSHFENFEAKPSEKYVCDECLKIGSHWVHLRTCQTCGGVHCCDSSPGKHATKHFHESGHPIMISAEPGERWAWCYVDETILHY